jgi:hypothetical protein
MRDTGQDDVLPITLTEVIVFLFFVLALAFTWNARALESVPDEIVDRFVDGPPVLEPEKGWTVVVRCVDEVDKCDPGAADVLVDVATQLGISVEGLTPSEVADSVKRQIEQARAAADSALQDAGIDPTPARDPGPLRGIVAAFRGQGDYPPCWADYSGARRTIIYALDVTLYSGYVRVVGAWPRAYQERANQVPNLTRLAGSDVIDYTSFGRLAAPVLSWSNRQEPPCRHYVIIRDSVSGGDEKETFKANLLTVEGFFYKNLVN